MVVGFIDLFLGNPFLLFVVIAAIISFFQNSGGNKKEDQRRKAAPRSPQRSSRDVQKRREMEIDWREIFRQESAPIEKPQHERKYVSNWDEPKSDSIEPYKTPIEIEEETNYANIELLEKYERLKEKQSLINEKVQTIQQMEITSKPLMTTKKAKQVKLDFRDISGEDAIKGIVWSEILSKPKSRSAR